MAQTSNYGLGKPDPTTTVAEEIERLIATWDQLDMILKTLADAIATKAAANHNQAIGTITGLTEALAGKMAASKTFAVADLTDVSGSVEAALGYVLAKTAMGFSFQSAASLLGNHQHGVADIVGLTAAIDAKIAALVASSPATLDTLAELATALGNDPNFATTIAAQIADAARLTTGIIPDARLPLSLRPLAQANVITDCNEASRNGWYAIESSGANKPSSLGGYVFTIAKHTDWWVQYFFTQSEDANNQRRWRRFRAGSTWGSWVRIYEAEAELLALIDAQIAANTAGKGSSGILTLAGVSTGLITGIPAGVSKVSVALAPLVAGANNGYPVGIQLGTASGIVTAGYSGGYAIQTSGTTTSYAGTDAAYFIIGPGSQWSGLVEFTRFGGNKWVWQSSGFAGSSLQTSSGNVDLGAELTQLQIRMSSGTIFNSGSMKLFWE